MKQSRGSSPSTGNRQDRTLAPFLLSALVYPGTGQLVQRQYRKAALVLGLFTACLVYILVRILQAFRIIYGGAFSSLTDAGTLDALAGQYQEFFSRGLLFSLAIVFGLSLLVWAYAAFDAWRWSRRTGAANTSGGIRAEPRGTH